jgi:hypothetical protein
MSVNRSRSADSTRSFHFEGLSHEELSSAIRRQKEVLSFACDPADPVKLDSSRVQLLTDAAVRHGSRAPVLSLQGNDLSSDFGSGIRALGKFVSTNTVLRRLDVSMCRLGNYGSSEVIHSCVQTRRSSLISYVTHVNLSLNGVNDEGLLRIGRILAFYPSCIRVLTMKYNPITLTGLGAFLAVNVPVQILDVSFCLLECNSVEGESGRDLQEVLHGLRRNHRTEAIVAAGSEAYIIPAAAGRMVETVTANTRSKLAASIRRIANAVNLFHEDSTHRVSYDDSVIRNFVAKTFDARFGDDEHKTPERGTHGDGSTFKSPLRSAVAGSAQKVYASPPPPVEAEHWTDRPVPIPTAIVLEAIAKHDGPIVCAAVVSPTSARLAAHRQASATRRRFAPTDVHPVEKEHGVHHATVNDRSLHVDPIVPPRKWAHHPPTDAPEVGADGSSGAHAIPVRRQFRFLYEDKVPAIGRLGATTSKRAEDEGLNVTTTTERGSTIGKLATLHQRLVDGRKEMAVREKRAGSLTSRSGSTAHNQTRSTSAVNTSRASSPGRSGAASTAASSRSASIAHGPSAAERAVAIRKLLSFAVASSSQAYAILFEAHQTDFDESQDVTADRAAAIVDSALTANGYLNKRLPLKRPLPEELERVDARPSHLSLLKLGSEERVHGIAKVLWCLLHATNDVVEAGALAAATTPMVEIPPEAPWTPRGKATKSQLVHILSQRRAEENRARRVVETLTQAAQASRARSRTPTRNVAPRYRSQSQEWVERRRSMSEARGDDAKKGPLFYPEDGTVRGKRVVPYTKA